jgi:hypothetical protein
VYDSFNLSVLKFKKDVNITSFDKTQPATLTGFTLNGTVHLHFSDLILSAPAADPSAGLPKDNWAYSVNNSNLVSFSNITMIGDPAGTLATQSSGIQFNRSHNCSITGSTFQYLHHAISLMKDNNVHITNNSFSWLFDDGVRGGGTSNLTVTGNNFTNMHYDPTDTDHPDCIQLWTRGIKTTASNITISNNTYVRGAGGLVHGVYVRDEGGSLPYQNVVISGNQMTGLGWDGITVQGANNLSVSNNSLRSYLDARSHIQVDSATNATVAGNSAAAFVYTNDVGLVDTNNTVLDQAAPISGPAGGTAFVQAMAGLGGADSTGLVSSTPAIPTAATSLALVH